MVNSIQYRLALKTKNWQDARSLEKDEIAEIKEGKLGSQGKAARQTFSHKAERTYVTDRYRNLPLNRFFGDTPLRRITADLIVKYQSERKEAGASGRTINMEVGLLRRILKRHKQWARLTVDITMLNEGPKPARVLSPHGLLSL